jgi:hypothetical protein
LPGLLALSLMFASIAPACAVAELRSDAWTKVHEGHILCCGGQHAEVQESVAPGEDQASLSFSNLVDQVDGKWEGVELTLTPENVGEYVKLPGRTVICNGCNTGQERSHAGGGLGRPNAHLTPAAAPARRLRPYQTTGARGTARNLALYHRFRFGCPVLGALPGSSGRGRGKPGQRASPALKSA